MGQWRGRPRSRARRAHLRGRVAHRGSLSQECTSTKVASYCARKHESGLRVVGNITLLVDLRGKFGVARHAALWVRSP